MTIHFVELVFRFVFYVFAGLTLEMLFSTHGIELCLALKKPLHRRVPFKYFEGFVSVYMIPLHGFGMLFLFEPLHQALLSVHWGFRYLVWAVLFSVMESFWGWFLLKTIGFYPWDYYKESRFKVFREGYTLWTLVPLWGVTGLVFEKYADLLAVLAPAAARYILGQ